MAASWRGGAGHIAAMIKTSASRSTGIRDLPDLLGLGNGADEGVGALHHRLERRMGVVSFGTS